MGATEVNRLLQIWFSENIVNSLLKNRRNVGVLAPSGKIEPYVNIHANGFRKISAEIDRSQFQYYV